MFTFEQITILIGLITTNLILIITAIRNIARHNETREAVERAEHSLNRTEDKVNIVETNTNSTLTKMQEKIDTLINALHTMSHSVSLSQEEQERLRLLTAQPLQEPGIIIKP